MEVEWWMWSACISYDVTSASSAWVIHSLNSYLQLQLLWYPSACLSVALNHLTPRSNLKCQRNKKLRCQQMRRRCLPLQMSKATCQKEKTPATLLQNFRRVSSAFGEFQEIDHCLINRAVDILDIFGSSDLSFTIFGAIFGHHGRSLLEPLVDGTSVHLEPRSLDVISMWLSRGAQRLHRYSYVCHCWSHCLSM